MSDIVAFLNARLDEDQAAAELAQASDPAPWSSDVTASASTNERNDHGAGLVVAADDTALWDCEGSNTLCMTAPTAQHVARHHPARVLREVKAKRAIVWQWEQAAQRNRDDECDEAAGSAWATLGNTLVSLAGVYDSHPDYAGDRVENWKWPDDDPAWGVE